MSSYVIRPFTFACLLAIVLACEAGAQSFSPISTELQLCSKPSVRLSRPTIAVNEAGEVLVVWGDSAVWTDADPALLDRELPPANVRAVFGLEGERWTGIRVIGQTFMPGVSGWGMEYHFASGTGKVLSQVSGPVWSDGVERSMMEPGSGRGDMTLDYQGWALEGVVWYTRNQYRWTTWAGAHSAGVEGVLGHWVAAQAPRTLLSAHDMDGWAWADSSRVLLRISQPSGNESVVYRRSILPHDIPLGGTSQHLIRGISLLGLLSGTVEPFIPLDTLHRDELDLSDVVLPRRGTDIDIIRRDMNTDDLFVERFDFRGRKISVMGIVSDTRVYHVLGDTLSREEAMREPWRTRADYAALPLDSGRTLIAWSSPDGDSRAGLRIAVFDADWRRVGQQRIVSSGDGWRVYPALALRRNRLYVVWQHRLAEGTTPWMRVYELDQLLSSPPPPPVAAALAVDGPWPQPASAQLQCIIQPPQGARRLHVAAFDALGRRMYSREYDAVTTVPVTLDVRDWPDGIYMLRIRFDDTVKMLRFSVLH